MTETRVTDPRTGGQKGVKSERFDLLPWDALAELARVYGFGATKYEPNNWRRGYAWSLSVGALCRHLWLWLSGERRDAESGRHHLAHAAWHCLTLLTFEAEGLGTDDRVSSAMFTYDRPIVVVESPYKAHEHDGRSYSVDDNVAYARAAVRDCLDRGEAPYASHLLYTQVYDDATPRERLAGLHAGWCWQRRAAKVVVYTDRGVTPGMEGGIRNAEQFGVPIEYRSLPAVGDG